ncbi:MAG TPA: sulfatase [Bacteroidales bacterium]|nr:sulfatase [Bacteroidales bacterium]HOK73888.1 sulfatase [Bacteroidales bacterium]HOM39620.1 sulfatase [Bacteroidales bacterium]HOU31018.1 sulfatase [Bacteroidales bacterium]HPP91632.1 sulfatase [Bacteroidales bacterium]
MKSSPHLPLLLSLSSAILSCSSNKDTLQRPNILFIMSDDHAWQAVSAYGGPLKDYAPTPNIDRIAQNGIRFDRCLVTNSISGPSRAVILTGKYSHLNGFLSNEAKEFDGSQQTFPKLLQKAGYTTAIIGKWHLVSNPTGFDHWEILPGQGQYYNPDFITAEGRHREEGYVTEIITEKCIKWLSEVKNSGKPFMLMMHHKAPHREWQPGPNELTLYKDITFPEPPTLFDDYSGRGRAEREQDMTIAKTMRLQEDLKLYKDPVKGKNVGLNRMTPEQAAAWDSVYNPIIRKFYANPPEGDELVRFKYQRYMQDYLACIAAVDKSVGRILDYLKETGLDKNTIVIYTSDQGFYLGEHGWFDKRFMFEESYRTPLLISWPGVTKSGSVNKNIVSNLDFAETFLDAAGVKIPSDMQGESLVPLLKGKKVPGWRKEHYYHYYEYPAVHSVKRHYGISTERYKLIHFYYDIDEWELFDLQSDPMEMKNVYNDPAYDRVKKQLHKRLEKIMKKYGDSDELALSFLPAK